jgi:hypothetical protein
MAEDEDYWPTPEEAALGSFSPAAEAKLVRVRWLGPDRAEVHIKVGPDYDYFVTVSLAPEGWMELHSHN